MFFTIRVDKEHIHFYSEIWSDQIRFEDIRKKLVNLIIGNMIGHGVQTYRFISIQILNVVRVMTKMYLDHSMRRDVYFRQHKEIGIFEKYSVNGQVVSKKLKRQSTEAMAPVTHLFLKILSDAEPDIQYKNPWRYITILT